MEMSAAKLRRLIIIISEKQNSQTGESFARKRCLDRTCNLGKGEVRQAVNTIVQDYGMGGIRRHIKLQGKSLNKYHFSKNGMKVIGEGKKWFLVLLLINSTSLDLHKLYKLETLISENK